MKIQKPTASTRPQLVGICSMFALQVGDFVRYSVESYEKRDKTGLQNYTA